MQPDAASDDERLQRHIAEVRRQRTLHDRLRQHLDQKRASPEVRRRILRLNRYIVEGQMLAGWHPTKTARRSFMLDVVTRQTFVKRWGADAYRALPDAAFVRPGGKRRWVSYAYYAQPGASLAG